MNLRMRNLLAAFVIVSSLTACAVSQPLQVSNIAKGNNVLFFSDTHNVGVLDLNQEKVSLLKNEIFLQSLNFDRNRKQIVAPGYSPDSNFAGLLYFDGEKKEKIDIVHQEKGFAPIRLYQYENTYLMNSAQALMDGPLQITELGFYDTKENKMVKKIRIPGIVQDISGNGSKAYVSSYNFPGDGTEKGVRNKSNIYEIDLVTKEFRKVFKEDQDYVPFEIEYQNGYLYGVYQSALNVPKDAPQNLFVKIDLKTGEIVQKIQLSDNARDLVFSADGKYAFVTHFYALFNKDIKIANPLTRIDLSTFNITDIRGDYRAVSILEQNGKIYIGDDLAHKLTVINEHSLKVEKTIQLEISPIYLANETHSGNQHVQ